MLVIRAPLRSIRRSLVVIADVVVIEGLVVWMLLIADFAMKQGSPDGTVKVSTNSFFKVVNLSLFAGVVPPPASPDVLLLLVKIETLLT